MSMIQARDGDHRSYADIACSLQSYGASPTIDMHELWSRMIFNMCIYNVDDHLRNHGFLHEPLGWRLSPLYDLEIATPDVAGPFLHTGVFDDGEALLDFDEPLRYAEFFRLSPADAVSRIAGIQHAVSFWRYEAEKVRAKRSEIDHMASAFEYMAARRPLNAR